MSLLDRRTFLSTALGVASLSSLSGCSSITSSQPGASSTASPGESDIPGSEGSRAPLEISVEQSGVSPESVQVGTVFQTKVVLRANRPGRYTVHVYATRTHPTERTHSNERLIRPSHERRIATFSMTYDERDARSSRWHPVIVDGYIDSPGEYTISALGEDLGEISVRVPVTTCDTPSNYRT